MNIDEWRAALIEVASDSESAPGPRVRALELLGRDYGFIQQHRPRGIWWRLIDRCLPTEENP